MNFGSLNNVAGSVRSFVILTAGLVLVTSGVCPAIASETGHSESRDLTPGKTWIERLERPDRLPGLRIDDVVACLGLKPGDVVADIGAGTGVFSIPFAKAVAPTGAALAQDIWPELLEYIAEKAKRQGVENIQTVLGTGDSPGLADNSIDLAFFHDVFHNVPDRQAYLRSLAASLKPGGRIAIIEQEFDDPIAKKWDVPANRITPEQVAGWMSAIDFRLLESFDLFQGDNNPPGAGMPQRWFVVYGR